MSWKLFQAAVACVLMQLSSSTASANDRVTLRFDFYAGGKHSAFAYGIKQGIYARHGIDLRLLEGTGSGPTTQVIAAGTDRFGYADAFTMAKLAAKGLPVRMIASYVQKSPWAISYFSHEDIKTLRDLYGKKVSFTAGDAEYQIFPALMAANNLDISKVKIVYLAPQAKQSAVMVGTVDAMGASYAEQASTIQKESNKPVSNLIYADLGANTLSMGLIINAKYMNDQSLNCRMVAATNEAFAAAIKHPRAATTALLEMFPHVNKGDLPLTEKQWILYAKLVHTQRTQSKPFGYMDAQDWAETIAIGNKYGDFGSSRPISDYYTNQFINCK